MAHHIDTARDFQYGLEQAWHRLTKVVGKITKEMFPEIFAKQLSLDGKLIPFHMAVASDDNLPIGEPFCHETYPIFTPHQAWDYVHEVLGGTAFTIESIGMLKDRTVWFISTRLNELESLKVDGDKSETHFQFNFSGGLNRQFSPQCEVSGIRAVCWNTVSLSRIMGKVLFKSKCTKNFQVRLDNAKAEIEKAIGMTAVFNAAMSALNNTGCDTKRAERIYTGFLAPENAEKLSTRVKNQVEELTGLFNGRGIGCNGRTLYDTFNAFTEFRTRGSEDSTKDKWSQIESSEYGQFADQKAEFANVLSDENRLDKVETRGKELIAVSN